MFPLYMVQVEYLLQAFTVLHRTCSQARDTLEAVSPRSLCLPKSPSISTYKHFEETSQLTTQIPSPVPPHQLHPSIPPPPLTNNSNVLPATPPLNLATLSHLDNARSENPCISAQTHPKHQNHNHHQTNPPQKNLRPPPHPPNTNPPPHPPHHPHPPIHHHHPPNHLLKNLPPPFTPPLLKHPNALPLKSRTHLLTVGFIHSLCRRVCMVFCSVERCEKCERKS